jgi:hypothetical protein
MATRTKAAHRVEPVEIAKREHPLERLKPEGVLDLPPENSSEFHQQEETSYALARCKTINPNANTVSYPRRESPHTARNRRPVGWTAIWITLPKDTVEALQQVAIALAQEGQHSPWPKERRRYPKTKSHLIGEALDDFFRKVGFPEFCLQQPEQG